MTPQKLFLSSVAGVALITTAYAFCWVSVRVAMALFGPSILAVMYG